MATYFRRDDTVQNALGYAIPNVAVAYYVQPSLTLATVYNDSNGDEVISNPQFTDGLGHADAYMASGLYTITYSSPQIQTLTLPDQSVGPESGGGAITVFAGTPEGAVNGVNRVFTLTNNGTPLVTAPTILDVWLNFPLIVNVGYTITGVVISFAQAPLDTDTIWAQGIIAT